MSRGPCLTFRGRPVCRCGRRWCRACMNREAQQRRRDRLRESDPRAAAELSRIDAKIAGEDSAA